MLVATGGRGSDDHDRRVGDVCRSDAVGEIEHSRAIGGETNARRTGYAAEAIGHQGRTLFVTHPDESHIVPVVQGIENVQERGANDAENMGHTLLFQQFNHCLAGLQSLGQLWCLRERIGGNESVLNRPAV